MTGMEALAKIQAMGCSCYCAAMAKEIAAQVIPLPESEILARAREAVIARSSYGASTEAKGHALIRRGEADRDPGIQAAIRALRDLAKPLSEVVPAVVDPDITEAQRIVSDEGLSTATVLAAIRRGRELEREARS